MELWAWCLAACKGHWTDYFHLCTLAKLAELLRTLGTSTFACCLSSPLPMGLWGGCWMWPVFGLPFCPFHFCQGTSTVLALALLLGLCFCSCTFAWTLLLLLHFCLDFVFALALLLGLCFCSCTFAWTFLLLLHFCMNFSIDVGLIFKGFWGSWARPVLEVHFGT